MEAFALTGRNYHLYIIYPGCCPGLGASALSGRVGQTITGHVRRTFLERVRESDRHELLKLPIALIVLALGSIIETRIEEDIR